jgi:Peptidase family M23
MDKPWFMYPITVPFGNPNYDSGYGGSHDLDIGAPPNYPVTALLPGTLVSITEPPPPWGKQVGIQLDTPYNGIPFMAYLHLSAVNPALAAGQPVSKGDLIGWVGGANDESQYAGTSNPTGDNFPNDLNESSQVQVGVALMRGPEYGITEFYKWQPKGTRPVEWELDPTQIILDAIKGEDDMLQISNPFAAANFTQIAEERWHCVTTNQDVFGGILSFYRSIGGAPRLPLTGEQHDIQDVTYQVFEAGVIVFDPGHKQPDHPTGFEPSYLLKLNSELAKKLLQLHPLILS